MSKNTTSVKSSNHEELKPYDFSLDKDIPMVFKKRQWIIIFNVLVRSSYTLGYASLVQPIVDLIEPFVAQASQEDVKPVIKSDIPKI
jgi:hypothetical protein